VSGVGVATTLGFTYAELAEALLAGRSGVRAVTAFDVSDHPSQVAARLDHVPIPPGLDPDEFARLSRLDQAALWCGATALRDAGLWDWRARPRGGPVPGGGGRWPPALGAGARPRGR